MNVFYLVFVYCEIFMGFFNDIGKIGEFCVVKNIEMIVDVMSLYVVVLIDM